MLYVHTVDDLFLWDRVLGALQKEVTVDVKGKFSGPSPPTFSVTVRGILALARSSACSLPPGPLMCLNHPSLLLSASQVS